MRLLLVDDEEDIRLIGKMGLERGGFSVTAVGSVEEALDRAKLETPDVILIDWLMPGRDGTEILGELAKVEALKRVPVIFLTARSAPDELGHLSRIGAAGAIAKPFDPLKIAREVRRILGGSSA